MPTIRQSIEQSRGCGYRKKGGIYLVCGATSGACGKLPIPLTVCPCCGAGIKFTRGFTWISADLFIEAECTANSSRCITCPGDFPPATKLGLLWVGEKFYKTTGEFSAEAATRGISRRIATVPHNFKIGVTWVALAHIKAINNGPGIFSFFRPSSIEYIVTGEETEIELQALEDRGFTLVNVVPDNKIQLPLLPE